MCILCMKLQQSFLPELAVYCIMQQVLALCQLTLVPPIPMEATTSYLPYALTHASFGSCLKCVFHITLDTSVWNCAPIVGM